MQKMEHWRSWPWKKRSSKQLAASASFRSTFSPVACLRDQPREDGNYVEIPMESYRRLCGMEAQVGILQDQVEDLKEKLCAAHLEVSAKDDVAKQHAKVAEEAVSGWEKANAEALTAKDQRDSVSLSKLAAEDRASHLDAALKECMREMRSSREENEQKLHDVIFDKTKSELEAKIIELDQQLLRATAENAELTNVIIKNKEEISEARAEIEVLKHDIKSSEQEIYSLRYELQVTAKELDANKQYLASMKTISKLKAECQRLQGLANLGHDMGEPQTQTTTSVKHTNPYFFMCPDISTDNLHAPEKNDFLSTCLSDMEGETKTLKEALAAPNSELETSNTSFEDQRQVLNQHDCPKSHFGDHIEGSPSQDTSNPTSVASISEDGINEEGSCMDSWAPWLTETSHSSRNKCIGKYGRPRSASDLELMYDFVEMEGRTCSSVDGDMSGSAYMDKGSPVENKTVRDDSTQSSYVKGVIYNHDTVHQIIRAK